MSRRGCLPENTQLKRCRLTNDRESVRQYNLGKKTRSFFLGAATTAMADATQSLPQLELGDGPSASQLLPLVYTELRTLAAQRLSRERPGQTLQPTALVHEAYLRLVSAGKGARWNSQGHFFAAAAEAMRRILVERARQRLGPRAGGGRQRRSLDQVELPFCSDPHRLLEVNDALDRLTNEAPMIGDLVKLRIFAGLSVAEAAQTLQISRRTAFRHWTYARAWLRAELAERADLEGCG